jgi:hypothetical protein
VWSEPGAVRDAVRKSLREAWLALSFEHGPDPRRWVWGALHELRFRGLSRAHPGLGPFPYGGAPHAVLAAGYSSGDPFAVSLAATARFAVDTATLDIALTALAPGQSEAHPSRSSLDGWLRGASRCSRRAGSRSRISAWKSRCSSRYADRACRCVLFAEVPGFYAAVARADDPSLARVR